MIGLQAGGQVLGAEHLEVLIDLEDFSFGVQMVYWCHHDTASGDANGGILDGLQFSSGTWTGVCKPDRGCIREE